MLLNCLKKVAGPFHITHSARLHGSDPVQRTYMQSKGQNCYLFDQDY